MGSPRRVGVVEDRRYQDHEGPSGHPERPERLAAVGDAIAARREALQPVPARSAQPEEILRVHRREHLAHLEEVAKQAPGPLDPDTYMGTKSFESWHEPWSFGPRSDP